MGHKVPQKAEKYIQVLLNPVIYPFSHDSMKIYMRKVPKQASKAYSGTFWAFILCLLFEFDTNCRVKSTYA